MKQHSIHTEMIKKVAGKLGSLRQKVVFLGGSATGFHITDEAAPEIRATKDVDIIVEVASRVDYHKLEKTLQGLGFSQKMQKDAYSARFRPAIPEQAGHPFRLIPATHSGASRPRIPDDAGHPQY